jgi:hypothetical protein
MPSALFDNGVNDVMIASLLFPPKLQSSRAGILFFFLGLAIDQHFKEIDSAHLHPDLWEPRALIRAEMGPAVSSPGRARLLQNTVKSSS